MKLHTIKFISILIVAFLVFSTSASAFYACYDDTPPSNISSFLDDDDFSTLNAFTTSHTVTMPRVKLVESVNFRTSLPTRKPIAVATYHPSQSIILNDNAPGHYFISRAPPAFL